MYLHSRFIPQYYWYGTLFFQLRYFKPAKEFCLQPQFKFALTSTFSFFVIRRCIIEASSDIDISFELVYTRMFTQTSVKQETPKHNNSLLTWYLLRALTHRITGVGRKDSKHDT